MTTKKITPVKFKTADLVTFLPRYGHLAPEPSHVEGYIKRIKNLNYEAWRFIPPKMFHAMILKYLGRTYMKGMNEYKHHMRVISPWGVLTVWTEQKYLVLST